MKNFLSFFVLFFAPLFALADLPTRINNGLVVAPYLYPKAVNQELGASTLKWDLWVDDINGLPFSAVSLPSGGSVTDFLRGDVTWQTLDTGVVPESGNLYFTEARARTSISASSPLAYDNSTGVLSMPAGSSLADGYLSASVYNVFNAKEPGITAGTSLQYWRGDKTFQTLNTAAVPESGNLYHTDARARGAISASAPVAYDNSSGVISMPAGSSTQNGYLSTSAQGVAGEKTFENALGVKELSSSPANPDAGYQKLYAKDDGKVYRLQSDGTETELGAGAGGAGDAVKKDITQSAHGFSVGDWVYLDGGDYALADADDPDMAEAVGVVTDVIDTDNFTLTTSGYVSGLSGLVAGTPYYISQTAGEITATEPATTGVVSKLAFLADSTTTGFVVQTRGRINGALGGGMPGTDRTAYTPTITGFGSVTGREIWWKRIGDDILIWGTFVSGTTNSSTADIALPSGLSIDSAKVNASANQWVGTYFRGNNTSNGGGVTVIDPASNTTSFGFGTPNTFGPNSRVALTRVAGQDVANTTERVSFNAMLPISGWSSSAAGNVGDCGFTFTGYSSYPSTNTKVPNYSTVAVDTSSTCLTSDNSDATNGASATVKSGKAGNYFINVCAANSSGANDNGIGFTVNGSALTTNIANPLTYAQGVRGYTGDGDTTSGYPKCVSGIEYLNVGDTVRPQSNGQAFTDDTRTKFQVRYMGP